MADHLSASEEKRIAKQIEKMKTDPYASVAVQSALDLQGESQLHSQVFEDPESAMTGELLQDLAKVQDKHPAGLLDFVTTLLLEFYKKGGMQFLETFLKANETFWETERKTWNDAVSYLRVYVTYAHWSPIANLADPKGVDLRDEAEDYFRFFVGLDKLSIQNAYDNLNHCHNKSWWKGLIEKLAKGPEGPDDITFRTTLREKLKRKREENQ